MTSSNQSLTQSKYELIYFTFLKNKIRIEFHDRINAKKVFRLESELGLVNLHEKSKFQINFQLGRK